MQIGTHATIVIVIIITVIHIIAIHKLNDLLTCKLRPFDQI